MSYVAAKGGKEAIDAAEMLVTYYRLKGNSAPIQVQQIMDQMRLAVDRVMGEGSLYAPELAALALKQAEGDTFEASFLLRAFRSTLPRNHYSLPADTTQMRIIRRISAAFKDIPGGQYLGPTRDYTKRLLDFTLLTEGEEHIRDFMTKYLPGTLNAAPTEGAVENPEPLPSFPRVVDLLDQEGLLDVAATRAAHATEEADDITRQSLRFPASRATRLQTLARGETGSMMALAYSSMRGYGAIHPSLGELKIGYVELSIPHPLVAGETITVGEVLITEVELIAKMADQGKDSVAKFTLGYGTCFGQNEIKAISMATLDRTMMVKNPQASASTSALTSTSASAPAEDEEFVLYHIDGIESSGFTAHWKLPHYVDFQADMNRLRSVQERRRQDNESV